MITTLLGPQEALAVGPLPGPDAAQPWCSSPWIAPRSGMAWITSDMMRCQARWGHTIGELPGSRSGRRLS